MNPCIQISRFPPLRLPGRLEGRTDSAEYVKTMTIKPKHGYHLIQHEPAFPDDKFEYSATGVPPIRKSGTAFPRKVYRLSAKVYRLFFRL